jgi:aspartate-semialdehyde dehydrogenase
MAERRSSVLAVPLSAHVHGQERKSSVSGGGLGAIRAEVIRGPANSIPSIEEEDEENEKIQESNERHLSTAGISTTDVQAPVFRIPVFDGPSSPSPVTEQPPTAPHVIHRKQSVTFGVAGPTRSISPTRQPTRESTKSSITEKSTHTSRKSVLVRSRTKSVVLPAYIQEANESQKKQTRQKWVSIAFKWTYYFFCLCAIYFSLIGLPLWKGCAYWL